MKGYYRHPKKGFTGRSGIEFKDGYSVKVQDTDFAIRYNEMINRGCKFIPLDELKKSETNKQVKQGKQAKENENLFKEPEPEKPAETKEIKINTDKISICPVCGSEFEKKANNQKYCSQACKRAKNRS